MAFDLVHITSLFENASEGFVITNSAGIISIVNPAACAMFGYSSEELVGQPIEILIPSSQRRHHVGLRDNFDANPGNRVMGHGRDLKGQKKNGNVFPVEVSLSTYQHEGERFVTAFIIDITTRKSIEQNMLVQQSKLEKLTDDMRVLNSQLEKKVEERTLILQEALEKLEQSQQELSDALDKERQLNEIKSRFVSMASHEFRTPLSTVLSSASLLSKYTKEDEQEKRSRHIEKIKGSVKHLNDLLEDFLSLGRLDEEKVSTRLELLDVHMLIADILNELDVIKKPGQQLIYMHSGEQKIYSDKNLIRNMLINLVSNAIKFSEEGKTIRIFSDHDGASLVIRIQDEGIGIPEEDQQHLYSSFFRAKNVINIQGTGLGLHIVKRYVELLGGDISLQSAEGVGTTVTLRLPVISTDELK